MKITKSLQKKRGQSATEYILILAVLVGFIMMFGNQFKTKISAVTGSLFSGVDNSVNGLMK